VAIDRASASTLGGRDAAGIRRSVVSGATGVAESHAVLRVPVIHLDPDIALPAYAHPGDAGLDLRAREHGVVAPGGGRLMMPAGIAVAIPAGYAGLVLPRSGNAARHGLTVANAPGLIDSGYRDELHVILLNTDPNEPFVVNRGDRIAQLLIQRVEEVAWDVIDDLQGYDRGGGFGHSGQR
jgi:dUTP pyrophosphatase